MSISSNLEKIKKHLHGTQCQLLAVSKTYPKEALEEAYSAGQRHFAENKAQEMASKSETLPKDICWHMIGHLQTNKVKIVAPFVHMIHSVDSLKLLQEIDREGRKINRNISCLLQIYIAQEETKFGLSYEEAESLLAAREVSQLTHVTIAGVMGMATNTNNSVQIRQEFRKLKEFYNLVKQKHGQNTSVIQMEQLSMGMSGDYKIAIEEGSTMIRIGSSIFGARS